MAAVHVVVHPRPASEFAVREVSLKRLGSAGSAGDVQLSRRYFNGNVQRLCALRVTDFCSTTQSGMEAAQMCGSNEKQHEQDYQRKHLAA